MFDIMKLLMSISIILYCIIVSAPIKRKGRRTKITLGAHFSTMIILCISVLNSYVGLLDLSNYKYHNRLQIFLLTPSIVTAFLIMDKRIDFDVWVNKGIFPSAHIISVFGISIHPKRVLGEIHRSKQKRIQEALHRVL